MPNLDEAVEYVTESDWIPNFWAFLASVKREDLIAELIQNDLDQGASRTVISFKECKLVSEGNGTPVDEEGWQRLRIIQGAGDKVSAKRGKIGVKNHGLKTAFTIGDSIRLMSSGCAIEQILRAEESEPPHPRAYGKPVIDSQAPARGCRIEIKYRKSPIQPTQGEAWVLKVPTQEDIDNLFRNACQKIPEQFAGIVSPGTVNDYEVVLEHWRLGEACFRFSCTRLRKITKRKQIEVFRRRCEVSGTTSLLPSELHEQAVRRFLSLRNPLKKRIAEFYRRKQYYFIEVSWRVNRRGKPLTGIGRFRYPIGYPGRSTEACTGHGASFNVPVVSNADRQAPVANEETNLTLTELCEELLVDALGHLTIPRWGPDGLNPLVPNTQVQNTAQAVSSILIKLAERKKLPILNWSDAASLSIKRKSNEKIATIRQLARKRLKNGAKRYPVVIPATVWGHASIVPDLTILCPRSEFQLHPKVHPKLIEILVDDNTPGFGENFITFDENDVFDRITTAGNEYFGAVIDRQYEFSEPLLVRAYLNLILLALNKKKCNDGIEMQIIDSWLLPDSKKQANPISCLYASNLVVDEIPGLGNTPVLHPEITEHPIFRKPKWRRPNFTITNFLESETIQQASDNLRLDFWNWLLKTPKLVRPNDYKILSELKIWPDTNGELRRLSDLCEPDNSHLQTILDKCINRPHKSIKSLRFVKFGNRGNISIRSNLTPDEITNWLNAQLSQFTNIVEADSDMVKKLSRFENDLTKLNEVRKIFHLLKNTEDIELPALAQDGSIQLRANLVVPTPEIEYLTLPKRYLISNYQHSAKLDKLSPTLMTPLPSMLIDALAEDSMNVSKLHARLRMLLSLTSRDDDERKQLSELHIIPFEGKLLMPSELAFKGNKGDFWGGWKLRIPGTGLSQDDQDRYRKAGVTSGSANLQSSIAFFTWLQNQAGSIVEKHITCVMRHILYSKGFIDWASNIPDLPFIPVESKDGVCLVSMQSIRKKRVFFRDAGDIYKEILKRDKHVYFAIDQVKGINRPINDRLERLGVISLRQQLGEPKRVHGISSVKSCFDGFDELLRQIQQKPFRNSFQKRLQKLGVELNLVRKDWHVRLSKIEGFKLAELVEGEFSFRRRVYRHQVASALDPESGIFWIEGEDTITDEKFYQSVASSLVFRPEAKPIHHIALHHAVSQDVSELSISLREFDSDEEDSITAPPYTNGEEVNQDSGDDVDEAPFGGHSPLDPDKSRNAPNPVPITNDITETPSQSAKSSGRSKSTTPSQERKHVEELKLVHYASHCQICICERTPLNLAPIGSYIEPEEIRRKVMDAHHVDTKGAGGARHAGNILILCNLHHRNFGGRLNRASIKDTLQTNAKDRAIHFGQKKINGKEIEFEIPDTGEIVKLFFTDFHASYWLEGNYNVQQS